MNEEKPFEGENPFRKLDKKRFLSHDEKKKAKSLKKNGLISNNDGEVSSFYAEFVSPQDEGETRAFLNAVSGVTKLGAPANAKREKRPSVTSLNNPVLGKQALWETDRSLSKTKKNNPTPEIAGKNAASSTPKKTGNETGEEDINFFAAMQDVTPLSGKGREVAAERRYPFLPCRRRLTRFRNSSTESLSSRLPSPMNMWKDMLSASI